MDDLGVWIGVAAGGVGATLLAFALDAWRRHSGRRRRKVDETADEVAALRNLPNAVAEVARRLDSIDERVDDTREHVSELTGLVRGLVDDGQLRRRRG